MNTPTKIEVKDNYLKIVWNDGIEHKIDLHFMRDESPDAGNKGETILWKHYEPLKKGPDKPGKYEVANIELVGNYAINIHWKDGDAYGIYSWDLLRQWGEFWEMKKNLNNSEENN